MSFNKTISIELLLANKIKNLKCDDAIQWLIIWLASYNGKPHDYTVDSCGVILEKKFNDKRLLPLHDRNSFRYNCNQVVY